MEKNTTWKHSFPINNGTFYYGVTISMPVSESVIMKGELGSLLGGIGISCFISLGGVSVTDDGFQVLVEHPQMNEFQIELRHPLLPSYWGNIITQLYHEPDGTVFDLDNYHRREDVLTMLAGNVGSGPIDALYQFYDTLPDGGFGKKCDFKFDNLLQELLLYGFA